MSKRTPQSHILRTLGSAATLMRPVTLASSALLLLACGASAGADEDQAADAGSDTDPADAGDVQTPDAAIIPDEPWIDIEAGSFNMGSPDLEACRESDETLHKVTLTRGFKMSSRETTQAQYTDVVGYNPSYRPECGPDCPVEDLNWHMAVTYCNALSPAESLAECYECTGENENVQCTVNPEYTGDGASIYDCPGYRLPTDAEWEYAYRADTETSLYSGALPPTECSGDSTLAADIGWFNKTATGTMHPVGMLQPNNWGLYDMGGNMQEWTHDFYQADLGTEDVTDPLITEDAGRGVIRGGSFAHAAEDMRGAHRKQQTKVNRGTSLGVRCVRSLDGLIE